jgi:hypothetical protein
MVNKPRLALVALIAGGGIPVHRPARLATACRPERACEKTAYRKPTRFRSKGRGPAGTHSIEAGIVAQATAEAA